MKATCPPLYIFHLYEQGHLSTAVLLSRTALCTVVCRALFYCLDSISLRTAALQILQFHVIPKFFFMFSSAVPFSPARAFYLCITSVIFISAVLLSNVDSSKYVVLFCMLVLFSLVLFCSSVHFAGILWTAAVLLGTTMITSLYLDMNIHSICI
jgi:hypothetical protein